MCLVPGKVISAAKYGKGQGKIATYKRRWRFSEIWKATGNYGDWEEKNEAQ